MTTAAEMPMFPLGGVLLPGEELPLHVFEPRYRRLVRDCMSGAGEFGVVLIERGSEVGGGDVRFDVGCVARIVEARELADGRWLLGTLGTRRIVVEAWLPDDPYPRALVRDWPDPEPAAPELRRRSEAVSARLRRVLAYAVEAGLPAAPATTPVGVEPVAASYRMAALAPIAALDRLRLLRAEDVTARLERLDALLADVETLLASRLEG